MNHQQSYESNMRVIGYLFKNIKDNYDTMYVEDFNEFTSQINRLFQQSRELLPSVNHELESEPIQSRRNETETQNAFQQSVDSFPDELNHAPNLSQQDLFNVTMTRGEHINDLSFQESMPMILTELDDDENADVPELVDDDDDSSNFTIENDPNMSENNEEYQEYISYKVRPKLATKCFTTKTGRERTHECIICCDEYNIHQTLTLGCGHEFCKSCVCDHFHFSVENQPYNRFYECPICRNKVTRVRVNYSKLNAKDKNELMSGPLVKQMKTWCK
jgi:hypothetical protein